MQQAPLFLLALHALTQIRRNHPEVDDSILSQALGALHKTLETRVKGLIYEHQPEDLRALAILGEIQEALEPKEDAEHAPSDRDLLAVVAALDAGVAAAVGEGAGPTVFLDTAERIVGEYRAQPAAQSAPLILEP